MFPVHKLDRTSCSRESKYWKENNQIDFEDLASYQPHFRSKESFNLFIRQRNTLINTIRVRADRIAAPIYKPSQDIIIAKLFQAKTPNDEDYAVKTFQTFKSDPELEYMTRADFEHAFKSYCREIPEVEEFTKAFKENQKVCFNHDNG